MADVAKLNVGGIDYDIKDAVAREDIQGLEADVEVLGGRILTTEYDSATETISFTVAQN